MLLAVAAASLVPPPEDVGDDRPEGSGERTEAAPALGPAGDAIEVEFRAGPSEEDRSAGPGRASGASRGRDRGETRASKTRSVELGKRVIVSVTTPRPGGVELEGLGRLQAAAPGAPTVFDLFTDSPGRFDVLYTPADGDERVVGTLVVAHGAAAATSD